MVRIKMPAKMAMMALLVATFTMCSKSFELIDPETGGPVTNITLAGGECSVIKIAQKNSGTGADNAFEIARDASLGAQSVSLYDSLLKKQDYKTTFTVTGDSISLSTGEYFLLDKTTHQVVFFSTRLDIRDPASDKQTFTYEYDANGYLIRKLNYINGSATPDLETNYSYANGVLKGCIVSAGATRDKLIESTLDYEMTTERKEWLYLFPDFFEGYHYLQALPFGKKGRYPLKNIVTKVYDTNDGSVLDTWTTEFTGYVFSQDNFILQSTAKGDLQQGLGLLYGTTRFTYACNK